MKGSAWIAAYERNNVLVGLNCGLRGRAQIGKGMWAMPDLMADMLAKDRPPQSRGQHRLGAQPDGCDAARVALQQINVQMCKRDGGTADAERATAVEWVAARACRCNTELAAADKQQELDNNAQGILGYVVRWVDQAWAAPRCQTSQRRPDGRPRNLAYFQPAHCQLAAPRRRERSPGP